MTWKRPTFYLVFYSANYRKQQDDNYIIIKKWVSDSVQQDMFAHTRQIKTRKAIAAPPIEIERETRLYVNDKKKDKMYMVRKKSPNRRSWIFS